MTGKYDKRTLGVLLVGLIIGLGVGSVGTKLATKEEPPPSYRSEFEHLLAENMRLARIGYFISKSFCERHKDYSWKVIDEEVKKYGGRAMPPKVTTALHWRDRDASTLMMLLVFWLRNTEQLLDASPATNHEFWGSRVALKQWERDIQQLDIPMSPAEHAKYTGDQWLWLSTNYEAKVNLNKNAEPSSSH